MNKLGKIFFLICVLLSAANIEAQPGSKVQALRVEFISKKLSLTVGESEKFWPLYNEYSDKLQAVKKRTREAYGKRSAPLTEAEAELILRTEADGRQEEFQIHTHYSEKMKAIIGAKKLVQLRLAEEEFKRIILERIKEGND